MSSPTHTPPTDRFGRGTRLALSLLAFALYLAAFPLLFPRLGTGASALVLWPILAVALLGGLRAGLGAAALGLVMNTVLLNLAGAQPGGVAVVYTSGGGSGMLVAILAGAAVGRLRDLGERLRGQLVERTRAEAALGLSEEQYRALFNANPQPMWIFDTESLRFLAVNDAAVSQYGYSRDEFLQLTIKDIRPPEDVPALLARVSRLPPQMQHAGTWRHRTKTGTEIEAEIATHAVFYEGQAARLVLAQDVSERRRLEEQLRQSQKMEAVGRLAGGVAHDFNNLLTVIAGQADLLSNDGRLPSDAAEAAGEVVRAADRAADLTRQLLAFGRRQMLRPEPLDLNAIVSDMTRMLRRLIGEHIRLVTDLRPELPPVIADRTQLEQVMMNLAANARDAMAQGGTLTLSTDMAEAPASVATQSGPVVGRFVRLRVRDTGVGMDEQTRARVFEPFFTTKEVGKGTGLGLASAYGTVRQCGGHLAVESAPGRGTTFSILMPPSRRPLPVAAAPAASEPASLSGCGTVLVVEDEDGVRSLACTVLRAKGYQVLEARDGREALMMARSHAGRIDLLLSDVIMPGLNGPDLARMLKTAQPKLRVLLMSGYGESRLGAAGLRELGADVLDKPFRPDALAARVGKLLEAGQAVAAVG